MEACSIEVIAVPANMVKFVWDDAMPLLQKAEDVGHSDMRSDVSTYIKPLVDDLWRLIIMVEDDTIIAASLVMVRVANNGVRSLLMTSVGGKKAALWADDYTNLCKEIAKNANCKNLMVQTSRKGWERLGKAHGWEPQYTTYIAELE